MKGEISVLIADDNVEFAKLLKEYMNQYEDIEVLELAKDGLQAIEMIISKKPDVVVLDIIMPTWTVWGFWKGCQPCSLNTGPSS